MFDKEAERLCEMLLGLDQVSPLLNLGSSTAKFRKVDKPHIEQSLFGPLRRAGIDVVHCDLKSGEGVDLVADILDPAALDALKGRAFKCVLLSNLLEHVRDREKVAESCEEIVGPGGFILVSVPFSYPYHADPIDTYYRPSPKQLESLFKRSRCLLAEELQGRTYRQDLDARGSNVWREAMRTFFWFFICFARPRSFASKAHRWLWYYRPYRVSIALLEVT